MPDLWGQGLHIMCDWIFFNVITYSIQLPSSESKLHTLCSLKSGGSTGWGYTCPTGHFVYLFFLFLISSWKHVLWVLFGIASMRQFLWIAQHVHTLVVWGLEVMVGGGGWGWGYTVYMLSISLLRFSPSWSIQQVLHIGNFLFYLIIKISLVFD